MAATKSTKTTAKSSKTKEENTVNLGNTVMLYTKSSSHWYGLSSPEIVTIADVKFVRGTQITGKEGHRMEGKITLIPLDHVASIIEFELEEDLWSEPQPKNLPLPVDESRQSAVLTSHEQLQQPAPKKRLTRPSKGFNSRFSNKFKKRTIRYSEHNDY